MERKILNLTLKKEPFEEIKSGKKRAEYRDHKPYWIKRLINEDGSFKQFDFVYFRNGYHKNAPALLVEIIEIRIIKERRNCFSSQKYFEIVLGQIVNTNT